jgi:glycosyltransferase involved in cell wall biosynthesis
MKILHILSQKPSFSGSGTFYNALINESIKQGISPYLVYSVSTADRTNFFEGLEENTKQIEFDSEDIPYSIPGMSDVMPYASTMFSQLSPDELSLYFKILRAKISQAISEFNPEIIWTHHLWVASSIVKEFSGKIPVIAFCHGSDILQSKKSSAIFNVIKPNLEKIDITISTSPQQFSEISQLLTQPKVLHIGNGIREDVFYLKKTIFKEENFTKLSYAGKISKEKGVHCLISSVKKLIDEGMKVELSLFGSSPESEFVYIKSLSKGYEESIKFLGNVSQEELSDSLNNTDIFILPSFYEGLGLVVLEAIACGCRAIITDLPNLSSVLSDKMFETNIVSKVPLPNIHGSMELEDLTLFCEFLKEKIKEQSSLSFGQLFREEISNSVSEFTYKSLFEKLIGISKSLIFQTNNHE